MNDEAKPETPAIIEMSIKFQQHKPVGQTILRQFTRPKNLYAILIDRKDEHQGLASGQAGLRISIVPPETPAAEREVIEELLLRTEKGSDGPFMVIAKDGTKIRWRPGLAVIEGPKPAAEEILPAIIDFSHREEMLRDLESSLDEIEPEAPIDVQFAYRIRKADRSHWRRIAQTMEKLARMRLKFARLEPTLRRPARDLNPTARKCGMRLLKECRIEERLESLGDRLEACEDLYEGANDRINDYRMYRDGHKLEIIIILLLAVEVMLMAGELYYRYLDFITPVE